jgi:hypothetical protein
MLPFYPCPYWGQSIFVTVGSFVVSNQLVAESIMVRHMKFILVFSLPLKGITVCLASIYNPQIEAKSHVTSGGSTKLFYCCVD